MCQWETVSHQLNQEGCRCEQVQQPESIKTGGGGLKKYSAAAAECALVRHGARRAGRTFRPTGVAGGRAGIALPAGSGTPARTAVSAKTDPNKGPDAIALRRAPASLQRQLNGQQRAKQRPGGVRGRAADLQSAMSGVQAAVAAELVVLEQRSGDQQLLGRKETSGTERTGLAGGRESLLRLLRRGYGCHESNWIEAAEISGVTCGLEVGSNQQTFADL